MSKRSEAIRVMKANEGKPMADVVKLIAETISVTEANAKSYYRYIVQHNLGPGTVEKTTRASTPKAPKAPKVKIIKAKPVKLTDKPKVTDKTVEELADIRAKNLARLKAVGRKYAKGRQAEPRFSDEAFDESAVPNLETELDSLKVPAFLTKDQVKALV